MTEPDVHQALAFVAYLVLRHGEAYVPLLDRLEREAAPKEGDTHRDRAQRILRSMTLAQGAKRVPAV